MLYLMISEPTITTASEPRFPDGIPFGKRVYKEPGIPMPDRLFTTVPYLEAPGVIRSYNDLSDFLDISVHGLAFSSQILDVIQDFCLQSDQGIIPLTVRFDTTAPLADIEYHMLYQRALVSDTLLLEKSKVRRFGKKNVVAEVYKWHIDLKKWGDADVRRVECMHWMVSERFRDAILDHHFSGYGFEPVEAS